MLACEIIFIKRIGISLGGSLKCLLTYYLLAFRQFLAHGDRFPIADELIF